MKTKIFYDFEATSVSRDADMISVGLTAVTDYDSVNILGERSREVKTFYSEFTDFNIDKCGDWVKENVVDKLRFKDFYVFCDGNSDNSKVEMNANATSVSAELKLWLMQFEQIEFWADYDVIDKPMLIDLIADWGYNESEENNDGCDVYIVPEFRRKTFKHKIGLPKHLPNINYDQFFDLHTLFKVKGVDTDISREVFIGITDELVPIEMQNVRGLNKHNALYDAYVSWLCYQKLIKI